MVVLRAAGRSRQLKTRKEKLDKFFTNEGYYFHFEAEVAAEVELPVANHSIAGLPRKTTLPLGRFATRVVYLGRVLNSE